MEKVLQAAKDAGLPEGATEAQGAIFLGGLDRGVSALTMAAAYATFASGGIYAEPYAIARIVDAAGGVVYERHPVRRQAFRTEEVGVLNRSLQSVVTSGTGWGAGIGRPVAGKTGTSEDNGDAWFVGFVPQLSTAVWVGYEPRRPMWQVHGQTVSGGSFPAAIFAAAMRRALEGVAPRPIPTVEPDALDLRRLRPAPSWSRWRGRAPKGRVKARAASVEDVVQANADPPPAVEVQPAPADSPSPPAPDPVAASAQSKPKDEKPAEPPTGDRRRRPPLIPSPPRR